MSERNTPDTVFGVLHTLGIEHSTLEHPAAFTVDEGEAHTGHLPGVHVKNLFLCDAKKKMWLVTAPWDREIDLKALPEHIGSKRLSFGSADRLLRVLGVTPGSVSPFCVINDTDCQVQLVLDAEMMKADVLNAHPLVNTQTTSIRTEDLLTFVRHCNHEPLIVDLSVLKGPKP